MRSLDLREDLRFATFFASTPFVSSLKLAATLLLLSFLTGRLFFVAGATVFTRLVVRFFAAPLDPVTLLFGFSGLFEDCDLFEVGALVFLRCVAPAVLARFGATDTRDSLSR